MTRDSHYEFEARADVGAGLEGAPLPGRWNVQVAAETDRLVRAAAAATNRTLAEFVVEAALVEAQRVPAER